MSALTFFFLSLFSTDSSVSFQEKVISESSVKEAPLPQKRWERPLNPILPGIVKRMAPFFADGLAPFLLPRDRNLLYSCPSFIQNLQLET